MQSKTVAVSNLCLIPAADLDTRLWGTALLQPSPVRSLAWALSWKFRAPPRLVLFELWSVGWQGSG